MGNVCGIERRNSLQELYEAQVYMATFYKDRPLKNRIELPSWVIPIQVGASLSAEKVADVLDNCGENISCKNPNYCELTALYWIWKNCLFRRAKRTKRYYGLFHYRRWLDINMEDWQRIYDNDVDVVLPYPTVHEPDINEHHARYITEADWEATLQALKECAPEYYTACDWIFSQEYLYNYNILIAEVSVLDEYCGWLFPILERIEKISIPKGEERADRYIGYIGENLLTLYFLYNKDRLKIVHTGRIMIK